MIRLVSEKKKDRTVYQYMVLEHATGLFAPFPTYNPPTEINGVIYTPVNGRFEIMKKPDFDIPERLTEIHQQTNNSLSDERIMFGMLMRLKGWWGNGN